MVTDKTRLVKLFLILVQRSPELLLTGLVFNSNSGPVLLTQNWGNVSQGNGLLAKPIPSSKPLWELPIKPQTVFNLSWPDEAITTRHSLIFPFFLTVIRCWQADRSKNTIVNRFHNHMYLHVASVYWQFSPGLIQLTQINDPGPAYEHHTLSLTIGQCSSHPHRYNDVSPTPISQTQKKRRL
jgi:hypothetical protein